VCVVDGVDVKSDPVVVSSLSSVLVGVLFASVCANSW
jgi:hypothetical protein